MNVTVDPATWPRIPLSEFHYQSGHFTRELEEGRITCAMLTRHRNDSGVAVVSTKYMAVLAKEEYQALVEDRRLYNLLGLALKSLGMCPDEIMDEAAESGDLTVGG